MMKESAHLFSNTGDWDTGVIINDGTPEQRFVPKPVLELEDEGEGSLQYYFLTEEGIFLTGCALDEGYGYQPIWDDDIKEIDIADYPRHAACGLREIQRRRESFGVSQDK